MYDMSEDSMDREKHCAAHKSKKKKKHKYKDEESRSDKNNNVEDELNNEVSLPMEMKGEEISFRKQKKKKSKSKKKKKHKDENTESSESLHSEESRTDKNDNVEDELNNEVSIPMEMKGEEIIFKKQKMKKRKKSKHNEENDGMHGSDDDDGFDLHEAEMSEDHIVKHKLKKKKKQSKVQLTHVPCKGLNSSSIDLTDSKEINTSVQSSCEKLKKRKREIGPEIYNFSDSNMSVEDSEKGCPPMAKKKKVDNIDYNLKKRKREIGPEIYNFSDSNMSIEDSEKGCPPMAKKKKVDNIDYNLNKRQNGNKSLKNKTSHRGAPEAPDSLNRIMADMDSEINENDVGRIGIALQKNQNVENSDLLRYETLVDQESLHGNSDATEKSSDYTNIPPAALQERDPEIAQSSLTLTKAGNDSEIEESYVGRIGAKVQRNHKVENSYSSRLGKSVKQDGNPEKKDSTEANSDYTNMPPAALEERDPEIAALHDTELLHPYPEFFKELKHRGITWKVGNWSQQEIKRLEANWNRIFQDYYYDGDRYDILNSRYGTDHEKKQRIRNFVRDSQFYKRLGSGIKRPLNAIYYRTRYMFNDRSKELNENEIKEMIHLQKRFGNKWKIIGERMNKRPENLKWKWDTITKRNRVGDGQWTADENRKLVKAVKGATGEKDVTGIYKNLPWKKIAGEISSRHEKQCRDQWKMNLCFSGTDDGKFLKRNFTAQEKVDFIDIIVDSNWQDEADINWEELSMKFESTTALYLQRHWSTIKGNIENRKSLTFSELLEAILKGPYIRFLRQAKSKPEPRKMLLKNPLFDTLRDKMDVLEQDHEDTNSRNINEFETDGQNKCYITPDTDLGV